MFTKCVLAVSSFVLLIATSSSSSKVVGARRRCEEQNLALQKEVRMMQETQEALQGDLTALRDNMNNLRALVVSTLPEDCSVARVRGSWKSTTQVMPPGLQVRQVRCDQVTGGGGWTVILARLPTTPHHLDRLDFNRSWQEYKHGFGDVHGEFWIGNEVLHRLTQEVPNQLRVTLGDWHNNKAFATWEYFRVGSEAQHYRLSVRHYTSNSTAGDALALHNNRAFSTFDRDNDTDPDHCAQHHGGGWWYFGCYESHLTGAAVPREHRSHTGINWRLWEQGFGLKEVTMMIRPSRHPAYITP